MTTFVSAPHSLCACSVQCCSVRIIIDWRPGRNMKTQGMLAAVLRGPAVRQYFRHQHRRGHALNKQWQSSYAATPSNRRLHSATRMCSSAAQSNDDDLPTILAKVAAGTLSPAMATDTLAPLLVSGGARAEDVGGYAKIDHDRHRRTGFPEVIFGEGKSAQHIVEILQAMVRDGAASAQEGMESPIVATRVSPEKWTAISATGLLPAARYHADARIVFIEGVESKGDTIGKVAVLSAGTSDLCVAEEAAVLAELAGAEVSRFHDVGVAGIHRLLSAIPKVEQAGVAICVAGMDGAMPGVVAGLVKCPVVAVPTSVGYGAAMSGLAPLLTMLNACAPGVSVVNIDNGFGAAAFAVKLLNSGNEMLAGGGKEMGS